MKNQFCQLVTEEIRFVMDHVHVSSKDRRKNAIFFIRSRKVNRDFVEKLLKVNAYSVERLREINANFVKNSRN